MWFTVNVVGIRPVKWLLFCASLTQRNQSSARFIQRPLNLCLFVRALITWSCSQWNSVSVYFIILQMSILVLCLSESVCVSWGGGGMGACEFVCLRLCPVWPLSVKVESSAQAYGKPQPSPRYSTIEAHSPEKPSETLNQTFFVSITLQTPYFPLVLCLTCWSSIICDPFLQWHRSMLNFHNSCVVTTCSGSRPVCSVHSGFGLVKKGKVAN